MTTDSETNKTPLELAKEEFVTGAVLPSLEKLATKYGLDVHDLTATAEVEDWRFQREEYFEEFVYVATEEAKELARTDVSAIAHGVDKIIHDQNAFAERIMPKLFERLERAITDEETPFALVLATFEKITKNTAQNAKLLLEIRKLMADVENAQASERKGLTAILSLKLKDLQELGVRLAEKDAFINNNVPIDLAEELIKDIEE